MIYVVLWSKFSLMSVDLRKFGLKLNDSNLCRIVLALLNFIKIMKTRKSDARTALNSKIKLSVKNFGFFSLYSVKWWIYCTQVKYHNDNLLFMNHFLAIWMQTKVPKLCLDFRWGLNQQENNLKITFLQNHLTHQHALQKRLAQFHPPGLLMRGQGPSQTLFLPV